MYFRYWFVFFIIQSADLFNCIIRAIETYINFYAIVIYMIKDSEAKNVDFYSLKKYVYEDSGYGRALVQNTTFSSNGINSVSPPVSDGPSYYDLFIIQLVHLGWYTSDLFFWMIYLGAFVSTQSALVANSDLPTANSDRYKRLSNTKDTNFINFIKEYILFFVYVYDDIGEFIETKLKSFTFYNNFRLNLYLKFSLRFLCIICIMGALFKFYSNSSNLVYSVISIANIEDNLNQALGL